MKRFSYGALGNLCDVTIGRTPRRNEPRYWGGPHPWATIRDLDGTTLMTTAQGITDEALAEVMPKPVEPDTLLFSFKLTIGKMAFAGRSMHHNEAIAALSIRNPKVLDREFLFHALNASTYDEDTNHAVLGKVLNKRKVAKIEIPLPPLAEQRRIAGILNRAAKIKRLRNQAQELMREFIPALFVKMFGDPATNPMGWPRQKLGEMCIDTEHRDPAKNPVEKFRYVDISGVDNVRKEINAFRQILGANAPSRARKDIRADDVLLSSVRPNLNAAAMVPDQLDGGIASTGFCVLRANRKNLTPFYLFLYVTSTHFIETIVSKARGANYPAVSEKDIREVQIPLPPLHLQSQFSDIAEAAQGVVASAELGSQAAASLNHSLMSDFLEKST